MGLCCCKWVDVDNEAIIITEHEERQIVSNVVISEPRVSITRPIQPLELNAASLVISEELIVENAKLPISKNRQTQEGFKSSKIISPNKSEEKFINNQTEVITPINDIETPKTRNKLVQENTELEHSAKYKTKSNENAIEKKRLLFRRQRVNRNIFMLKELLQCLTISKINIPIKEIYIETMLDNNSKQYNYVMSLFRNRKFNETYEIKQIGSIWNPYLFLQYKLMKERYKDQKETRILYHGTQQNSLKSILETNFEWRKVKTGKFGWGVSFANNPWYASHYSVKQNDDGQYYIMILARVLIGQTSYGCSSTDIPIVGDTTTNHDGQVLVKFDDGSFYPEFVIYFDRRL